MGAGYKGPKHENTVFCPPCCTPASSQGGGCCCHLVAKSFLFVTTRTIAGQVPLSMGFPRQEYYSGLPCPPPGDLPHLGTEPMSPTLGGGFFTIQPSGKPSVGGGSAKNSPFS